MPWMHRTIHAYGVPANTGSALNIHVYLRSSAANCISKLMQCPENKYAGFRTHCQDKA